MYSYTLPVLLKKRLIEKPEELLSLYSAENILRAIDYFNEMGAKHHLHSMFNTISPCIPEILKTHNLDLHSETALNSKMRIYLDSLVNLMTDFQSRSD